MEVSISILEFCGAIASYMQSKHTHIHERASSDGYSEEGPRYTEQKGRKTSSYNDSIAFASFIIIVSLIEYSQ